MSITPIKTRTQLAQEIESYIQSRFSSVDLSDNTVTKDMLVSAPARYIYDNYVISKFFEAAINLNSLETYLLNSDLRNELATLLAVNVSDVDDMIDRVVELHANNYGLARKAGTRATGIISFITGTRPTTDSVIGANTQCFVPNTNLLYSTTASVNVGAYPTAANFNFTTNVWEWKVGAIAQGNGTVYNVPQNLITGVTSGQGVAFNCINYTVFTGGTDAETTLELLSRVSLALSGNFQGTAASILSRVLSYSFVDDAKIAYLPTDPSKRREGLSNIDVFVKSTATVQENAVLTYSTNPLKLEKTYTTAITSVSLPDISYIIPDLFYSLDNGTHGTSFVRFNSISENLNDTDIIQLTGWTTLQLSKDGVDVSFPDFVVGDPIAAEGHITVLAVDSSGSTTDDTASWEYGSVDTTLVRTSALPTTTLRLDIGIHPETGDQVAVTHLHNSAIETLRSDITDPSVAFIGQNVEVFPAEQVPIYIDLTAQIALGYNGSAKIGEITTEVTSFISGLGMGSTINKLDIIEIVASIPGIVDVALDSMILGEGTEEDPPTSSGDVVVDTDEYPYLAYINIKTTTSTITNVRSI